MAKRYIVDLTADGRAGLLALLPRGVAPARRLSRARIPLLADGGGTRDRRRARRCGGRAKTRAEAGGGGSSGASRRWARADVVRRLEGVPDLQAKPYDPWRPVVRSDGQPPAR